MGNVFHMAGAAQKTSWRR